MLQTQEIVFNRGEDGQLLAQEVVLELLPNKPTVRVRPLTRGRLQEIFAQSQGDGEAKLQADNQVIKNGLVEPKLTEQDLENLMPSYAGAISTAILAVSLGLNQTEITEKATEVLQQEQEVKKN